MGKVIINGKTYDSLTGLQITDTNHVGSVVKTVDTPVETAGTIETVEVVDKAKPAAPVAKAHTPRAKRVSKQERLAAAVAEEFATEKSARHKKKIAPVVKKEAVIAPVATNAPNWISNFVEGHDPIEIEPIRIEDRKPAEHSKRDHVAAQHYSRNRRTQRSQTLNRNFVKKPAESPAHIAVNRRSAAPAIDKHPAVHRFAPVAPAIDKAPNITTVDKKDGIVPVKKVATPSTPDTPFMPAVSHNAAKKLVSQPKPAVLSSSELKDFLIQSQLDQPIDKKSRRQAEKSAAKFGTKRYFTRTSLVTAALAVAVLGGYMAYINMPSLSIRVAANSAGIDSDIPYTPNGYSLDGPVAYSPGQLTIKYKSNSGGSGYSITEQTTGLDSREAFASSHDEASYTTEDLDGVTVYYYGNNAVWVKDGVLYTLNGNHLLGNDQITQIVQSV